ncbi:MAG: metal ABC transporter ATP-binding protein [Anaerolineae bacterium]|nr:metal ABC transporter ATP-binding protein [Anaerolineae bacterium]
MRGVTVAYAEGNSGATVSSVTRYALRDISFALKRGELVAVIGPNGAGKSTLLRLAAGTIKPSVGTVLTHGTLPSEHICIAFVPQRSQVDLSFPVTVEDVVMMGRVRQIGLFRRPHRRDWEYVRKSLERVNAVDLAKRQIGELSGGQQQRVFIARALAQETDLMLLDEPMTGLDVPSQEKILEILGNLRPDGVTVLVATHDLNLAAERFDRVMLLNKKLLAFGPGAEVVTTENLLAAYGGHIHHKNTLILDDDSESGDETHGMAI